MDTLSESAKTWLKGTLPNTGLVDVEQLVKDIEAASQLKQAHSQQANLADWYPDPHTVKELLRMGCRLADLGYCVDDFKSFARSKDWTPADNLNAKLIGHIKLMLANDRISLAE